MLSSYDVFADFYDRLMYDIDYPAKAEYYAELFRLHSAEPHIILDLACGTGGLTAALASFGYDMIGVDASSCMLTQASAKSPGLLFICQDMRSLDLYGTVDAVICHLDGINHLLSPDAVKKTFGRVSLFLSPNGLFVFDLNTRRKLEKTLGNNTFVYDQSDIFCIWQNEYCKAQHICNFSLTFFVKEGSLYKRYEEQFAERAYSSGQICTWLRNAGMELEAKYDDFSFDKASAGSKRVTYVARKEGSDG